MAGYSGTPLAKKLGIAEGSSVVVVGAPRDYLPLLEPLPRGINFGARISKATDIVHVFSTRRSELQRMLGRAIAKN